MTVKDAGDDPDITNGIKIYATARKTGGNEVRLLTGEGIGVVTKPGLAAEVGKPAINPVPYKMIMQSIREVLPEGEGVEVTLSIPEGVEIAKKTFNPRLGIEGGISVLGTTGIVKPMSEDALKSSLELNLKQIAAQGHDKVIMAPGNYATKFLQTHFEYEEELLVQTSNYIGFMLEKAVKLHFKKVILVGHVGKLIKLAAGIFHTHSRVADARNEIMASHYLHYSDDAHTAKSLFQVNTTEEAADLIQDTGFWGYMALKMKERAEAHVFNELDIEVVTFSNSKGLLGMSCNQDGLDDVMKPIELLKPVEPDCDKNDGEIVVCGIGPGNPDLIVPAILKEVSQAGLIVGGERQLSLFRKFNKKEILFSGKLDSLAEAIDKNVGKRIVVLVSGDTGFYSLRNYLSERFLECKIRAIPGISSYQYFYSKLNMGYERAFLASVHGRSCDFMDRLDEYDSVFLLTDKKNSYQSIAQELVQAGKEDTQMYIGNKLSYPDEVILSGTAEEVATFDHDFELCSVILHNSKNKNN